MMSKIPQNDIHKRIVAGKGDLPSMTLPPIKMKDKAGRDRIVIDCQRVFGFLPKTIVIDKIAGQSNTIRISALLPEVQDEKAGKEGA